MNKRYYSYSRIHPMAHPYALGSELKSVLGEAAMGIASKAINPNGNKTVMSDGLNAIGDLAGMIPGYGTAAKYIIKGLNAVGNAAFGSNVDYAAANSLGADLDAAQLGIGSSTTVDTLRSSMEDFDDINVLGADLGSQGWFNKDVDIQRNQLLAQQKRARAAAQYAYNNINTLGLRNMMGTALADGGGIHIKPSKKGTFTAQATWHSDGGPIFKTDYDMGLTFVNAGGTHEQNPYGGVFMGMAPDGQPNQVEEGEVIFNDYVYSNRLKVPKAVRNKYKLRENKEISFADAIEEYIRKNGIEERNNDPIANRGLEAFASELAMEQEMVKAKKEMRNNRQVANGGHLFAQGGDNIGTYSGDYSRAWSTYSMPGVEQLFRRYLGQYQRAMEVGDTESANFARQTLMDTVNQIQNSYKGISGSAMGTKNDAIRAHQAAFNAAGGNYGFNGSNESLPGIDALIKRGYTGSTGDNAAGSFTPDGIYGWRTNIRHFGSNASEDAAAMKTLADMANQMGLNWSPTLSYGNNGQMLYTLSNRDASNTPPAVAPEPLFNPAPADEYAPKGSAMWFDQLDNTPSEPAAKGTYEATFGEPNPVDVATSAATTTTTTTNPAETDKEKAEYDPTYWWRMAGLGANAAGLMYNLLDPYHPQVVNEARAPRTINPRYLGDYISYNPYDINYATSQQDANSAATRNALMQSSAPIRNASLLANDFNNNATRGATRRQALEYNDALRKAVAEFNRGTNQFNAQMYVDAATKNQAARQAYYQDRLRQAQFNSQLDFQHKMMRDQAIGQGLTSIADYLNDMAKQRDSVRMIQAEIDSGARDANIPMRDLLTYFMTGETPTKACGGRLKIKTPKKR